MPMNITDISHNHWLSSNFKVNMRALSLKSTICGMQRIVQIHFRITPIQMLCIIFSGSQRFLKMKLSLPCVL